VKDATLAIDAGGTTFKSALVGDDAEILPDSSMQVASHSDGAADEILAAYHDITRTALEYAGAHGLTIAGLGVATPGPFDYERGASLMTHKFQAIRGLPLRDRFRAPGLLPADAPIVFVQDVHAFLLGEHWGGAARGIADVAAITVGTGLGFGVMKDGRVLDNGKGGPHRVVFDLPYGDGILEDRVSRRGIIAAYRRRSPEADLDVVDIAAKARGGDVAAAEVFAETGAILGRELAGVLSEYAISDVVFGGQISRSFDLFGPRFQKTLSRMGQTVRAARGGNLEFAALLGAARALKS